MTECTVYHYKLNIYKYDLEPLTTYNMVAAAVLFFFLLLFWDLSELDQVFLTHKLVNRHHSFLHIAVAITLSNIQHFLCRIIMLPYGECVQPI